jgi:hypothetical protein
LANKNRTVVKDGRLQVKPKRTDRSYLQPQAPPPSDPAEPAADDTAVAPAETIEQPEAATAAVAAPDALVTEEAPPASESPVAESTPAAPAVAAPDPVAAFTPPPPAPAAAVAAAPVAASPRGGAARALQQQGVRKRREVDVNELARRDSSYAMHELRRIAILTVMVVVALIVLAVVLR